MQDHTIAIVLDEQHAREFAQVLPNWLEFHPELRECRWLIVLSDPIACDLAMRAMRQIKNEEGLLLAPDHITFVNGVDSAFTPPGAYGPRETALWHYLTTVPHFVRTPRWTKIDTDCIALPHTTGDAFLQLGADYAVTGSPWGYTKPPGTLDKLGEWVKSHWPDAQVPKFRTVDGKDKCPRLIGWFSTHDTAYTQELAQACLESPPPVISHDTLTWLVAEVTGRKVGKFTYKDYGWDHINPRYIQQRLDELHISKHAKRVIHLIESIDAVKCVEVGVFRGQTSQAILRSCPDVILTMIDPWKEHSEGDYRASGDKRARDSQEGHDKAMKRALALTNLFADRRNVVRANSTAAASIARDTADLVFIDAAHDYASVKQDIEAWHPLVRPGGILCGHDYGHRRYTGVKQAVDEFALDNGLKLHVDREATVWWINL